MEKWKGLVYRGEHFNDTYEISNNGKLRNKITGVERKQNMNKQGYMCCVISRGRKRKILIKTHRAVAENFVNGNKEGLVINHKDGNKLNNNYSNLEFVTIKENNEHARKLGLQKCDEGSNCHNAKLTDDDVRKIRKLHDNKVMIQKKIAEAFNVGEDLISLVVNRKSYKNVV